VRVPDRTVGRLTLLSRAPEFRLLFFATAGSAVGTYLTAAVLALQINHLTHSGRWISVLLVADFLPIAAIGFTLGPLVDRLSRKHLMVTADLARCVVFCALPFVSRPAAIVALAAVAGVATGFFRPAAYAGLPNLVDGDGDLTQANALFGSAENAAWAVGPILAGLLYQLSGARPAYVINAVTFLFSALLVARIPASRLQAATALTRGYWRDVADGFGIVIRTPQLRTVLLVWNVVMAGNAALNVGEVFFATDSLHSKGIGYGALVAATGVGLMIGSLTAPLVMGRVSLRRVYPGAILVMAVGSFAASRAPSIWIALPLAAFMTIGNAAAIVCNQLLLQRGAPDAMRGRAIAMIMSSTYVTLTIATAVAGPLKDAFGGRALWAGAGGVYLVASAVAFVLIRLLSQSAEEPVAALAPEPVPASVSPEPVPSLVSSENGADPVERMLTLLEEVEQARVAEAERRRAKARAADSASRI
jgi:MFS family permease